MFGEEKEEEDLIILDAKEEIAHKFERKYKTELSI